MPSVSALALCSCAAVSTALFGGLVAPVFGEANDEDDLPVDFSVYTEGNLARAITMEEEVSNFESWQQQWAAATVPGYEDASRLAKYAVDGRGKYWISNSDSAMFTVVFDPYKWVHVKYPWDATMIILTRKNHIDFLRMYHEDEDDVRDYPYLLNRVENSRCMTDKTKLQETLGAYTIPGRGPGTLVQTPSHIIRNADDCAAFLDSWGPVEKARTWVHKLAAESQGKGIAFFPPGSPHTPCNRTGPYKSSLVMQSHIDYPLVLSGKKSEIRAYWVIASVEPFIVMLYHTGTVRLATHDYIPPSESTLDDWGNPLVHILNTRQQKNANPDYKLTSAERKRAWPAIPKALREQGRIPADMTDSQWIAEALLPVLNQTVHTVARAAQPILQNAKYNHLEDASRRFELFGLDIIFEDVHWRESEGVENNLGDGGGLVMPGGIKAWVTEAQVGPGLSLDNPTKIDVLPPMLTEMSNVVLEIDHRRLHGERLDNIGDLLTNFSIVINDATPEWRMKSASAVKRAPLPEFASSGQDAHEL